MEEVPIWHDALFTLAAMLICAALLSVSTGVFSNFMAARRAPVRTIQRTPRQTRRSKADQFQPAPRAAFFVGAKQWCL